MTKEERQLLLKDLCARLPYGAIILHEGWNYEWDDSLSTRERVVGIDEKFIYTKVIDSDTKEEYREDKHSLSLFDDKPYLRPMSSMMEKEKDELYTAMDWYGSIDENGNVDTKGQDKVYRETFYDYTDWLNAHHFDYRGLIEKGLALEAPEGMYKYEKRR